MARGSTRRITQFSGSVSAAGMSGQIQYAGYTRTAPFLGVMSGPLGSMQIGVLDNTGGQMLVYDGRPTLGVPGSFSSVWD
jgi:hypothetical protein